MVIGSFLITIFAGVALSAAGALWYKGSPRYHAHMRRVFRLNGRRVREAQNDMRYIGAMYLIGAGVLVIAAMLFRLICVGAR